MILAHQGGWDEALFAIGPLVFIVAVLRMAKNRADRANREREIMPETESDPRVDSGPPGDSAPPIS